MLIKRYFVTLLVTLILQMAQAQRLFNELFLQPHQTTFTLNAPQQPILRLYADDEGGKPLQQYKMRAVGKHRWTLTLKRNLQGKFYTFDIGRGETPGVFATAVGVNGKRAAIIDRAITNPAGWAQDKRPALLSPADQVIYELHVRDFTHKMPNNAHPDKFLGVADTAALAHLKRLGVTAVHLLPSFDFSSIDETKPHLPAYNWGYDPQNYNVPEGSYATNAYDPATRIKEFKQMVQALHRAGIRVILDVVYNHTADIEHSNFQRTYPDYYYRKRADGGYSDGSGCGNETASEKPLMRAFIIESIVYWAQEYHIDGFRFDLMGVHDIKTMNAACRALHKIDPSIFVYGEGWSAGQCAYPSHLLASKTHMKQMPGIAAFSDELRDGLRGPFYDDKKGAFIAGVSGAEERIKFGIVGGIAHPQVNMQQVGSDHLPWNDDPTQFISYVSCHDDMCLVDRLRASVPNLTPEMLVRLDCLAQSVVMLSQGVPFMLSGEEMLRDKQGVHNSYQSPIEINALPWQNLQRYPQLFTYYQRLIALRRHHPAFRLGNANLIRQHLSFLPTQPNLVGFILTGHAGGDVWDNIVVVFNANNEARKVTVPKGRYTIVASNGTINETGWGSVETDHLWVDAHSMLIAHQ
ncbi:pullulanase, type I [Segatella oulorum F0390]|uniref:Pullulanase, type I n=1 Tax=Segatella oulorum F0390 TaxID=702438 RepID=G1WEY9_9BACT|nr:type I pullulanase [Segatella oulorum]EGV28864.1 pullulanase, type I [Segatella oulorum F0390]